MGFVKLLIQQRLPAWQVNLTAPAVSIAFCVVAILCAALGSLVHLANVKVVEISRRYDNKFCKDILSKKAVNDSGWVNVSKGCIAEVEFLVDEELQQPVFLYYGLTQMYQNHRRYRNSRSDAQLMGANPRSIPDADPLAIPGDINGLKHASIEYSGEERHYSDFVYVPAGLVAWSMFNDSFTLYKRSDSGNGSENELICNGTDFSRSTNLPLGWSANNKCHKKGIAWSTDVAKRFVKPNWNSEGLIWTAPRTEYGESSSPTTNDTCWNNGWYAGEPGHLIPVTTDEDLMVWMRTSPRPTLRKLYRVIDTTLTKGRYVMIIHDRYNVASFGGEKSFILTSTSFLGGKLTWLSFTYFAVSGLAVLFSILIPLSSWLCSHRSRRTVKVLTG
uniref:WGS project CAEQ00000000 data, annotated contig 2165 n=1 Tax=Trypanosoma congolense (strain IL3000) TaxID=1068625 RepID=F9WC00_TRYCI|nr:unnamed protein product [Trypanosoma congolense IL3000]